ncbi:MAG: hypothetical protein R3191_03990 [Anaerolineales bacterium]|nr:hypothetical protein [Anaerolineales bacterium]
MVEIWVVVDGSRRDLGLRLHDELDLVAAAALADWLAGEEQDDVGDLSSPWRVPVRSEVIEWLVESTAQDRRAYARELMDADEIGPANDLEAVVQLLDGLSELARKGRRAGGHLVLTAEEG